MQELNILRRNNNVDNNVFSKRQRFKCRGVQYFPVISGKICSYLKNVLSQTG